MTATATVRELHCDWCFDTRTIDYNGREQACFHCPIEVRLTGLRPGLGSYDAHRYSTRIAASSTSITFVGTRGDIKRDVARASGMAYLEARAGGLRKGRNYVESGPRAIEARVLRALGAVK